MGYPTEELNRIRTEVKTYLDSIVTHMAIGSNSSPFTLGDTSLGAETFREAVFAVDTSTQNDEITFTMDIGTGENVGNIIAEIGGFDSASSPSSDMAFREVLGTSINKTTDIIVTLDVTTTIEVLND